MLSILSLFRGIPYFFAVVVVVSWWQKIKYSLTKYGQISSWAEEEQEDNRKQQQQVALQHRTDKNGRKNRCHGKKTRSLPYPITGTMKERRRRTFPSKINLPYRLALLPEIRKHLLLPRERWVILSMEKQLHFYPKGSKSQNWRGLAFSINSDFRGYTHIH